MMHDPKLSARGSAAVANLGAVPVMEAAIVRYLRAWCDGPDGQTMVWSDLSTAFGPAAAKEGLEAFERLLSLVLRHGRRPLMRHHMDCTCVGADEAVFAQLVTSAATADHEDAMLIGSLLVKAQVLPLVTDAARRFGQLLLRVPDAGLPAPSIAPSQTRH